MELKEGNLCFICDEFMDKYGIKYSIMENKGSENKRPAYFCFRDSKEKEILWVIPMSTQYEKYQKIYIRIREKTILCFLKILPEKEEYFLFKICFRH